MANQPLDQKNIDNIKIMTLSSLISSKLKNQEIIKYKINVSDQEILMQLSQISNNDINKLKSNFSKNELDFESFKEDIKVELGWRKLIYFLYNNKIEFDEGEINEELKKLKQKNLTLQNLEFLKL